MVKSAAQDQWRLLDLQALDTRLTQLMHRQKNLPEFEQLAQLNQQAAGLADQRVMAETTASDIQRELTRAEQDVEQVRQRAKRDQDRLDSGSGSAKDLQALAHELETLAARQSVLEDAELEVMERLEAAQGEVEGFTAQEEQLKQQIADAEASRDSALAEIEQERQSVNAERDTLTGGIPAELLALYERIRGNTGMGAAKLYQRRCEGCRLELNNQDLSRVRAAAEDDVLQCEECSRILVRTAESGL